MSSSPQKPKLAAAWPWLLPIWILGAVLHWPGGAGFKCDDYGIIRYVSDFAHVLHDFTGPQYDLEFFRFWRPLITLSFWIDYQLFGTEPFGYFAMNCLALLLAATFLFYLLRALRPGPTAALFAFLVALLWICHPASSTSLRCWAAGRVDTHYVPPLLLALWLHVRFRRGGARWPVWLAAIVGVATKESALAFPLLALAIDALDPAPATRPGLRVLGREWPAIPYLLLFPVVFGWRWICLDSPIGGYHSAPPFAVSLSIAPGGLFHMLGRILLPETPLGWRRLGSVAVLLLALLWLWLGTGRRERLLAAALLSVAIFGPIIQLFEHAESPDLRLSYFPSLLVILLWVGLTWKTLATRPRLATVTAILPLLWFVPGLWKERARMDGHDAFNTSLRAALRECDALVPEGEFLVIAGDAEHAKHPFRFGWAFGSVLKPPFRERPRDVVTLCSIPPGLPLADVRMVAAGLPAWVEVHETGARVVRAPPEVANAKRTTTQPRGFDGILDPDLVFDRAALDRIGYETGPDFTGIFAVCSTLGATTTVSKTPGKGFVSLGEILYPIADQFWAAMDLDKDCPLFLVFAHRTGVAIGRISAGPEFARRYVRRRRGH